jgi:hypothetical protein
VSGETETACIRSMPVSSVAETGATMEPLCPNTRQYLRDPESGGAPWEVRVRKPLAACVRAARMDTNIERKERELKENRTGICMRMACWPGRTRRGIRRLSVLNIFDHIQDVNTPEVSG